MKRYNRADRVLLIVFILFLISWGLRLSYRDWFFSQAFFVAMEAALVGGIADWFAVTALFKRPLGFPWHTAIIPRNRLKIIEAAAGMVTYEFLTKEKLVERIQSVRLVDMLLRWLEKPDVRQEFCSMAIRHGRNLFFRLNLVQMASVLENELQEKLRQLRLTETVHSLAKWVLTHRKDEQFITILFMELAALAEKDVARQTIYDYLQHYKQRKTGNLLGMILEWLNERTNAFDLAGTADSFQHELVNLLRELSRQPEHPLRVWIHHRLGEVAEQLATDPGWNHAIEEWKDGVMEQIPWRQIILDALEALRLEVRQDDQEQDAAGEGPVTAWLLAVMEQYWQAFCSNREFQDGLEHYLQEAARHIIENDHQVIGMVVRDALQALSDKELNRLIQEKTGEDLQWIRINGSVVGGLAGLAIYLLLQFLHSPAVGGLWR
ncbi:hypothetical protein P22_2673 [Propionispora sp. 2/2-37]|uniref:DUF445 domain-containing protein n=1 Tax=Propionispora sp. 2/2-37 TaxID=1677858 RepID=UPI0006BB7A99|nr:DUF445 domain-containing protein [Propionispora sp. 2/2-37]CUH96583.1 hypothetical protein P22_2673 [Propionispora sp. 2/2-37]